MILAEDIKIDVILVLFYFCPAELDHRPFQTYNELKK